MKVDEMMIEITIVKGTLRHYLAGFWKKRTALHHSLLKAFVLYQATIFAHN